MRVAVVGATGAVGREILRVLAERSFPADEVVALASERSEGRQVPFGEDTLTVGAYWAGSLTGIPLALFSAGGAMAREAIPPARDVGTICVDNSSAFRMADGVPLVIPELNGDALGTHRGIVANPNCTAITALMAVGPLHREFGLTSLVTSSYQSTSGAGMKGMRELLEQVEKVPADEETLARPDPGALPAGEVFGRTIAFNVVPKVDVFLEDGFTVEERKMRDEVRKILSLPSLPVSATAVRVPVAVGHGVSSWARFERPVSPDDARRVLARAPGVVVVDDAAADAYPTPLDAAGRDDVLVGRVRQADGDPNALLLFSVADNLRKGAALNAVQIAEALLDRGLVPD